MVRWLVVTVSDITPSNRMDSGRFEMLFKPYAFHSVIRSLFIPLRMATDARNLELVTSLDENIDKVARQAAYEAAGEDPAEIEKYMDEEEDGVVLGDAIRLRQIINNLARSASIYMPSRLFGILFLVTPVNLPLRVDECRVLHASYFPHIRHQSHTVVQDQISIMTKTRSRRWPVLLLTTWIFHPLQNAR